MNDVWRSSDCLRLTYTWTLCRVLW